MSHNAMIDVFQKHNTDMLSIYNGSFHFRCLTDLINDE